MKRWLEFFKHTRINPSVEGIWFVLFQNLVATLVPFVFIGSVSATFTLTFITVGSLIFHAVGWRLYSPITYGLAILISLGLKSSLTHGGLSGEFFATLFALLALFKSFNLRTYGDAVLFLILVLACNATVGLLDTETSLLVNAWNVGTLLWTIGNLLRLHLKNLSSPALIASLRSAALASLYTLPLLGFLFYIFQHFSHIPIYFSQGESVIGLSRSLEPGKISRLSSNPTIALRVKMNRKEMGLTEFYWRGAVLSKSTGLRWTALKGEDEINTSPHDVAHCTVDQTIYVPRSLRDTRFALDEPIEETFEGGSPYKITSQLCPTAKNLSAISQEDLKPYLKVDGKIDSQTLNLARKLRSQSKTVFEFRNQLYHYFKANNFKYTLEPKAPKINSDLAGFLFETKEGFCEHYAAAFATLARLAGFPARIVTGFQGGTYNSWGDYWLVSFSDAHAWVEIWNEKSGWMRMDPTSVVAPKQKKEVKRVTRALNTIWMLADAFFFWIRGIFDHRETLISLDDLTFNPFHLAALLFVIACWIQVRRMNRNYYEEVKKEFLKLSSLLNEKATPRKRSEGFENYRVRLLDWLDGQKKLRPLSTNVDKVFRKLIELRYSSKGLSEDEVRTLYDDIKDLKRALRIKTHFVTRFLDRVS